MNLERDPDLAVSRIAAAIGAPARARILYSLLDGHARTSTELAVVADVSPSTASVHLNLLMAERLIQVLVQGKHRYYSLCGPNVASALEGLSVLAGGSHNKFVPNTPSHLRVARTCYDHMAGAVAVQLHNHFKALGWLIECQKRMPSGREPAIDSHAPQLGRERMSLLMRKDPRTSGVSTPEVSQIKRRPVVPRDDSYDLTAAGTKSLEALGIDVAAARALRRRFAYACLDWSERQPHIGGALGAALLKTALKRKWVIQELDSRALSVTAYGRRELLSRFGLTLDI